MAISCNEFRAWFDICNLTHIDTNNSFLISIPSIEEVESVVFSLNKDSAPGPNGFGGGLYHAFWDIISLGAYNSVLQFFNHGWTLPNLNSNLVILIPKFDGADKIENFRPIALANFQFKVITKVITDRLSMIPPKIISQEQRGFLKDRLIS